MSMETNDPFDNNSGDSPAPQPQSGSGKKIAWIIGIIGGVLLLGVLVCCGAGYFFFNWALNQAGEIVIAELKDNPVVVEHLGGIDSVETNLPLSGVETEKAKQDDPAAQRIVFDATGPKGTGQLVVELDQTKSPPEVKNAILVTSDGERHDLNLNEMVMDDGENIDLDEIDDVLDGLEGSFTE